MKLINKIRIKKMLVVFTTMYIDTKKILAKRQDVINKFQVEKMGNVNPTHPRRSFIENQCSSLLLFNSCL